MSNLAQHRCSNKSDDFIVGDVVVLDDCWTINLSLATVVKIECNWIAVTWNDDSAHSEIRRDFLRHATIQEIQAGHRINLSNSTPLESMGDDSHIENHISPLCHVDEKTALNNMKQAEPLEKEVARLNSIVERQKSELVAMQIEIDLLNKIVEAVKREFCIFHEFTKRFDETTDTATMAGTMAGFAENIEEILGGEA